MRSLAASLVLVPTLAMAAPCQELPLLFIVQDKSGSMARTPGNQNPAPGSPSKWAIAQGVVPALAATFASRFRFGVEMYPDANTQFNCTAGRVDVALTEDPAVVDAAYAARSQGGGTPTAVALDIARAHIASLSLGGAGASVLLITDGLPNCNLSLSFPSCTRSTPECQASPADPYCTSLGAKDCLDTQGAATAAAALLAAGVKVFVVGFDSGFTSGNNKAVLDAIAAAGGTTSALVATSQAELAGALETIAGSTASCCKDACTAGAAQCTSSGERRVCRMDQAIGCTTWQTERCPAKSSCQGSSCVACTDQCTVGATRCTAAGAEQCVASSAGCGEWRLAETCDYGETCTSGRCASCQSCAKDATRCTAAGVERCEQNVTTGCRSWVATPCPSGSVCTAGACAACDGTCTAGARRCNGTGVEVCVADARGCTGWTREQTCATFCSGGACGTCGTSCTAGQTRCNGAGVETCGVDTQGCPAWLSPQVCAPGSVCTGGACVACQTSCAFGARRCASAGGVEECGVDSAGCPAWKEASRCDAAQGLVCDEGVCIEACRDACADGAVRCNEDGRPQRCERAPSGCTAWRERPSCFAGEVCFAGVCTPSCTVGELDPCPAGRCTTVPGGQVCVPVDGGVVPGPDAGAPGQPGVSPDAGVVDRPVPDAGRPTGGGGQLGAVPLGCACSGGGPGVVSLLGVALLALRRRGGERSRPARSAGEAAG